MKIYNFYKIEDRVIKQKKKGGVIRWRQLGFQDACSPVIEEFMFFHDFALIILGFILGVVAFIITVALFNKSIRTGLLEGQIIEGVWTALPALVLIQIAIPSLLLLYSLDEREAEGLTLKAIGHQWY